MEIIKKAIADLEQVRTLLEQWKAQPVIYTEDKKEAVSFLAQVLLGIVMINGAEEAPKVLDNELSDELQILKEHKEELRKTLAALRSELNQRTTISIAGEVEWDEETKIQKTNSKKSIAITDTRSSTSIFDVATSHGTGDPTLPTVDSLRKAIGISDKFLFIRELFHNSDNEFQRSIELLDNLNTLKEAQQTMQSLLPNADNNGDAFRQLNTLLIRRYKKDNE